MFACVWHFYLHSTLIGNFATSSSEKVESCLAMEKKLCYSILHSRTENFTFSSSCACLARMSFLWEKAFRAVSCFLQFKTKTMWDGMQFFVVVTEIVLCHKMPRDILRFLYQLLTFNKAFFRKKKYFKAFLELFIIKS